VNVLARPRLVLLPGLDGTGRLFAPFIESARDTFETQVVEYPEDDRAGYGELETLVRHNLPANEPFALIAESFSGPIAIRIAAQPPRSLAGVVLVATFARSPMSWIPRWSTAAVPAAMLGLARRGFLIRRLLVEPTAGEDVIASVSNVVGSIPPRVLARRVRCVLSVDVRPDLERSLVPLLYLRGALDHLVSARTADKLARLQPRMEVAEIQGPHFVLQRQPTESLKAIRAFLERLPSTP
jgi:pimeloyl-ACP methyl ester carboxylesterase